MFGMVCAHNMVSKPTCAANMHTLHKQLLQLRQLPCIDARPPPPPVDLAFDQGNNIRFALGYDWDNVLPGAAAVAVSIKLDGVAEQAQMWLEGYLLSIWQDKDNKCPKPAYSTVCYTPKGLAYNTDQGTLRATANMGFIAMLMAKYGDNKDANL
jgi:hypothetical protein